MLETKILLFHDLTRGIDVGTKAQIFELLRDLAASGHSILFYSSDNQELTRMCDRVLVLSRGSVAATLSGDRLTEGEILRAAFGGGGRRRLRSRHARAGGGIVAALAHRVRVLKTDETVVRLIPYVLLAALVAALAGLEPASFTVDATTRIVDISVVLILVGIGQTFVLLMGGIDLSVGGLISLVTAIAATRMASPTDAWIVTVLLVLFGWVPGLLNGMLIVYGRLQPFIVTLGTWFMLGGVASWCFRARAARSTARSAGSPAHRCSGSATRCGSWSLRASSHGGCCRPAPGSSCAPSAPIARRRCRAASPCGASR